MNYTVTDDNHLCMRCGKGLVVNRVLPVTDERIHINVECAQCGKYFRYWSTESIDDFLVTALPWEQQITHMRTVANIPESLASLDWKVMGPGMTWSDGTSLLVAQPNVLADGRMFFYSISIVVISGVDDDNDGEFEYVEAIGCDDNQIDFDLYECDFYVEIE